MKLLSKCLLSEQKHLTGPELSQWLQGIVSKWKNVWILTQVGRKLKWVNWEKRESWPWGLPFARRGCGWSSAGSQSCHHIHAPSPHAVAALWLGEGCSLPVTSTDQRPYPAIKDVTQWLGLPPPWTTWQPSIIEGCHLVGGRASNLWLYWLLVGLGPLPHTVHGPVCTDDQAAFSLGSCCHMDCSQSPAWTPHHTHRPTIDCLVALARGNHCHNGISMHYYFLPCHPQPTMI